MSAPLCMILKTVSYTFPKGCDGMKTFFSGVYLLAAVLLLLCVCGYCYPQTRQMFAGMEDSPVRQAFSTLAEGLETGEPVRSTMTDAVQVLFGQEG